jgi:hypothetical protein
MKKSSNQTAKLNTNANSQQKTLFQCWRSSSDLNQTSTSAGTVMNQSKSLAKRHVSNEECLSVLNEVSHLPDNYDQEDEDLELIKASETFMQHNLTTNPDRTSYGNQTSVFDQSTRLHDDDTDKLAVGLDEQAIQNTQYCATPGFDYDSGSTWIYPSNMPTRAYQYNIVEQCLYKNTMVVLPTGMGKTLIAAVVMFNFYRWYPSGKVIFMAPTKPLVNQQADACYQIVGISKEHMTQMTGQMAPDKRKALWNSKRVFFLTPQVISNDILRGNVDVDLIKCVVIDEAHKALGEYAFCKVIESINDVNKNFRVIALTATPGSDVKVRLNLYKNFLFLSLRK